MTFLFVLNMWCYKYDANSNTAGNCYFFVSVCAFFFLWCMWHNHVWLAILMYEHVVSLIPVVLFCLRQFIYLFKKKFACACSFSRTLWARSVSHYGPAFVARMLRIDITWDFLLVDITHLESVFFSQDVKQTPLRPPFAFWLILL